MAKSGFFKSLTASILTLAFLLSGVPAQALESERLFTYKHWYVEVVRFDDGSLACEATVQGDGASFSIWAYPDGGVELQFFIKDIWYGTTESFDDISLVIDRREPWSVSDARFFKNSILVSLPTRNRDVSLALLREIKNGAKIYVYNRFDEGMAWYSLSGSSASLTKLAECQDLL